MTHRQKREGRNQRGSGDFLVPFSSQKKVPAPGRGTPPARKAPHKNKTAFASKETKADGLCGTTLLAGGRRPLKICDITVTPGPAYGAKRRSAACSKGIFTRPASPPFHQNGRLSAQALPDYSSLSTQFYTITVPYYMHLSVLSTTFPGFSCPASSSPAHRAVNGATVTRPKEPTTVWISSAATYL